MGMVGRPFPLCEALHHAAPQVERGDQPVPTRQDAQGKSWRAAGCHERARVAAGRGSHGRVRSPPLPSPPPAPPHPFLPPSPPSPPSSTSPHLLPPLLLSPTTTSTNSQQWVGLSRLSLVVAIDGERDVGGAGSARRRRERRLRCIFRLERQTVAMELAAALHHSRDGREGEEGRRTGTKDRQLRNAP